MPQWCMPNWTAELRKQDIRVVIALGRQGLKAAAGLDRSFEVVAGAVLAVGENEAKEKSVTTQPMAELSADLAEASLLSDYPGRRIRQLSRAPTPILALTGRRRPCHFCGLPAAFRLILTD
jgi:hypothetical protein